MMLLISLLLQSLNVPTLPCNDAKHAAAGTTVPAPAAWDDIAAEPGISRAFMLRTMDPATVRLAVPFDISRGGRLATATIVVPKDGVYSVAIDRKAWIDMATGQALETSVAHRHGADGSGVAKIVDFRLSAGEHILGLTGVQGDSIRVRITPAAG